MVPPSALATSEMVWPSGDVVVLAVLSRWDLATSDCIWAAVEPLAGPPSAFMVSEMTSPAGLVVSLRADMAENGDRPGGRGGG